LQSDAVAILPMSVCVSVVAVKTGTACQWNLNYRPSMTTHCRPDNASPPTNSVKNSMDDRRTTVPSVFLLLNYWTITPAFDSAHAECCCWCCCRTILFHRRSQDFVWVHFFPQKCWRPFLVVALKRRSKTTKPTTPSENVLKLTLALPGVHLVCGGAITNFPCKLRLKFLSHPWGCSCTHCTPWLRLCIVYVFVSYHLV